MKRLSIILLYVFFSKLSVAQVIDYRDAFLGMYHTATPPCVQGSIDQYVLIEKDNQSTTGIIVTDTMWNDGSPPNYYGYRHPCDLIQSDSTYMDGFQLGKFAPTDSLKITGNACGFGYNYYLHKIAPIGLLSLNNILKECYLFPNPTVNELNIFFPGVNEELNASVFDLNGKELMNNIFKGSIRLDVGALPKGVYVIRITGNSINVSKPLILTE